MDINFLVLSLPMRTMTCLQEDLLVIILILGFSLSVLLQIDLLSSLIFLVDSSRKFFLIFRILLTFFDKICM